MDIGIVGLGRMGGNMARRLARAGVRVVGFDPDEATVAVGDATMATRRPANV